jgi:hypothetical protein
VPPVRKYKRAANVCKFVFMPNFDDLFGEQQHAAHCVEDFVSRSFLRFLYIYIHKHAFIGMDVGIELVECASDNFIAGHRKGYSKGCEEREDAFSW